MNVLVIKKKKKKILNLIFTISLFDLNMKQEKIKFVTKLLILNRNLLFFMA